MWFFPCSPEVAYILNSFFCIHDPCIHKQEIPLRSNVYEVYATDKDEGLNGAVQYTLLKTGAGNKDWEYFTIDANSGLIQTAMRLDREKQAMYSVSHKAEILWLS